MTRAGDRVESRRDELPKQSGIELPLLKLLHEQGGSAQPKEIYPKLAELSRSCLKKTCLRGAE